MTSSMAAISCHMLEEWSVVSDKLDDLFGISEGLAPRPTELKRFKPQIAVPLAVGF